MLKFFDYNITDSLEVPDEVCLNFHIAECQNRCNNCFSPELWETYSDNLIEVYQNILLAYLNRITCVCFLGEGKNTDYEHNEFIKICRSVHGYDLKTCLYCGRNCNIEDWMNCFDYIKIGSYDEKSGDLSCRSTNQKCYRKSSNRYDDITYLFWER